jgi:hypothetical protein
MSRVFCLSSGSPSINKYPKFIMGVLLAQAKNGDEQFSK